jgi:diphthamide synthase (EF-2-diphthine--ammonia ligase)
MRTNAHEISPLCARLSTSYANSNPKVHHYAVYDTSEKSLREAVLIRRVDEFVDKLLVNNQRIEVDPSGERYRRR